MARSERDGNAVCCFGRFLSKLELEQRAFRGREIRDVLV